MSNHAPRLVTLGRFELLVATPGGVATQAKRLALLAYLATESPRGYCRRDTLLGLLWPELGQEEARRALRQALHYLRQLLGDDVIITRADELSIGPGLSCDVLDVERAVADKRWADAMEFYRGPFLDGVFIPNVAVEFEEWIERTRLRVKSTVVAAAWALAESAEETGDDSVAARAAFRAHELAPEDEAGVRRLLELLHRQGDRAGALRVYDDFAHRMAQEYDLEPAAETIALSESIRRAPPAKVRSRNNDEPVRSLPAVDASETQPAWSVDPIGAATSTPARRRRPVLLSIALATPVFAVVYAIAALRSPDASVSTPGLLQPRDRVLVSDFNNETADSTLGVVLAEALRVDIAQSPRVRVLTAAQMRGALRLMERPVEVSVDDSLARAIALREGVKAFVTGTVAPVGSRFLISARLVAAPSGDLLAAVRETARDSTDLVAAIDRLSATLRGHMGDALRQIDAEPPLEKVTTASLPALRLFSQSIFVTDVRGDRPAAIKLLEEALALDSSFATAHRRLGALYSAIAEPGRAAKSLERAFAYRDRLPLRERYLTMGSYYRVVTREYEKAAAAYRALLELYPQDLAGLNNIALVYFADRQFARADSFFIQVIAIDSTIPSVHLGRAEALISESRFDSARRVLDRVWERFPQYPQTRLTEAYLAAARQDWPTAERHIRLRLASSKDGEFDQINSLQTLGQIAMVSGRLVEAEEHLGRALTLAESNGLPGRYHTQAILLAWLDLRYRRQPARALARVEAALAKLPIANLDPGERPYLELADLYLAAGEPSRIRALLSAAERDSAAMATLRGASWHQLRGVAALAEGRGRAAIAELRQADAAESCTVCVLPNLGQAYEQLGDTTAAIATYERYLTLPWIWRFETDALHMASTLRQLGELYERRQQRARASESYQKLLRLWSAADSELARMVSEVRGKFARLDESKSAR